MNMDFQERVLQELLSGPTSFSDLMDRLHDDYPLEDLGFALKHLALQSNIRYRDSDGCYVVNKNADGSTQTAADVYAQTMEFCRRTELRYR